MKKRTRIIAVLLGIFIALIIIARFNTSTTEASITIEDSLSLREEIKVEYLSKYMLESSDLMYRDLAEDYARYFVTASDYYQLNINHLVAIAKVESHFDRMAKSKKDCIGIMQINTRVWGKKLIEEGIIVSVNDLYEPSRNIMAGAYIYKHYLAQGHTLGKKYLKEYAIAKYVGTSDEYLKDNPKLGDHRYYRKWVVALSDVYETSSML